MAIGVGAGLVLAGLAVLVRVVPPARRGERGAAGDGFMKGVVKVSLIVMLVAGGLVWLLDRAEENNQPPDTGSQTERPDKPKRDKGGDR